MVAAALAGLAATPAASAGDVRPAALAGSLQLDGSSTVYPITQKIADDFAAQNPAVSVISAFSGTGKGMTKLCAGEIDVAGASRRMKDTEAAACQQSGVTAAELQIALDGLTVVVNKGNAFVDCLTVAELKAIWEPGSTVKNWNEVRPSFPASPITLFGPDAASGTFEFFTEAVVGKAKASRTDFTANEDDQVLADGVGGDANALGYFGLAYYEKNADKLKAVPVDGGKGCVGPSQDTVRNGSYVPLSRPLFIYVSKKSAGRAEVAGFVDFYFSVVQSVVPGVGYVTEPDDALAAEKAEWEAFKT